MKVIYTPIDANGAANERQRVKRRVQRLVRHFLEGVI